MAWPEDSGGFVLGSHCEAQRWARLNQGHTAMSLQSQRGWSSGPFTHSLWARGRCSRSLGAELPGGEGD